MSESIALPTPMAPEEPDRECIRCGELKSATEFHWTISRGVRRRMGQCRDCRASTRVTRKGKPRTPQAAQKRRQENLKARYGITEEQYEAMLAAQGGGCAICTALFGDTVSTRRLAVDHCHTSGRVRALLCTRCNRALGQYEVIREQADEYLARYGDGNPMLGYDTPAQ